MDKKVREKLTLLQLIKEKEKYEVKSGVKEELYIERLDATIVFEKPDRALVLESIELSQDKDTDPGSADVHILYNSIVEPNLKDDELQKAYACGAPTDIVWKVFEPGEVSTIAGEIMKSVGYGSHIEKVEHVKN
ncbi:hypothetical protein KZO01_06370 [Kurthia zopfii]|uniref:Phage XkdN-like protein n=1 Tax=Kurthia zopfii TaxID=1650 RepID=A0A8B4Q942_9BACL|nr:hypothetical protein [Kurthia zopfii]PWI23495.1 hypothetical protein DF281_02835 [Kurthia zopfii]TDR35523.1 XkdN-like tail assembly chaperone [Kurthia zopfii]GEK30328.1 hypothetical protein KZO01_06370 [Kurthia zopfii]STX09215.1 Phage XkdN-like protein [Kurthia zopfii]